MATQKIRKTQEQIDAEIKALQETIPQVPPYSFFGDSNRVAIDAQILVLQENMSGDSILDRYEDRDYILDAARLARDWLDGELGDDSLVADWLNLVKPR